MTESEPRRTAQQLRQVSEMLVKISRGLCNEADALNKRAALTTARLKDSNPK
jgi:hypothetical protein